MPACAAMDGLNHWIPACAGMTEGTRIKITKVVDVSLSLRRHFSESSPKRRLHGCAPTGMQVVERCREQATEVIEPRLPATGRSETGGRGIQEGDDGVSQETLIKSDDMDTALP